MINKTNILIGLGLVACAFIAAMAVSYVMHEKAATNLKEVDALQVQLVNLIADKGEKYLPEADRARVKRERIDIEDVLLRTERVYGEQELKRKDGILWIDRTSSACMITLGAANGLIPGTYLSVYDEIINANGTAVSQKVADVVVEKTYDIVSYVTIPDKKFSDFVRDYYRVTVKDTL